MTKNLISVALSVQDQIDRKTEKLVSCLEQLAKSLALTILVLADQFC
jgi:hypothetical protein